VLVDVDISSLLQVVDAVLVVLGMVQHRARGLEVMEVMEAVHILLTIVLVLVEVLAETQLTLHQQRLE
jgi:steroid 5-alpha reductase family enzyme